MNNIKPCSKCGGTGVEQYIEHETPSGESMLEPVICNECIGFGFEGCATVLEARAAFTSAVERAAYERAAQECERIPSSYHDNDPKRCADAIRALGEQHD